MDERIKQLKGSPSRDTFKNMHKKLDKSFYAIDADLCLISNRPYGTVAYLDFKLPSDKVTWAEMIQYNIWTINNRVYIIESPDPEIGPFTIRRYEWSKPNSDNKVNYGGSKIVKDWKGYEDWERKLRYYYTKTGGWGNEI